MKRNGIDRGVVLLLVCTLITVIAWVGFEVYRAFREVEVPEGVEKHLQGMDPTLKITVLDKLEELEP